MTRFSAQGPRLTYTPTKRDNPSTKLLGLYGMWASLSPETRQKIANLFKRNRTVRTEPTIEQTEAAEDYMDLMNAGIDVPMFNAMNADKIELASDPITQYLQDKTLTWQNLIDTERNLKQAQAMALGTTYEEPANDYIDRYRKELARAKENW